jgi:hypothetical protein
VARENSIKSNAMITAVEQELENVEEANDSSEGEERNHARMRASSQFRQPTGQFQFETQLRESRGKSTIRPSKAKAPKEVAYI